MKRVYYKVAYLYSKKFKDGICLYKTDLKYDDNKPVDIEQTCNTFEEFYSLCSDFEDVTGISFDKNIFGHRRATIHYPCFTIISEKNFTPVTIKITEKEVTNCSLQRLFKILSAKEFCDFLKDNGISFSKDF